MSLGELDCFSDFFFLVQAAIMKYYRLGGFWWGINNKYLFLTVLGSPRRIYVW